MPPVRAALLMGVLTATPACAQADRQAQAWRDMVTLIERRGVRDSATLAALRAVPRHEFVPASERARAYGDHPLPIGHGQTISQPYIVAFMTELLQVGPGARVLEVGTGSGYQAAVLAQMGARVFSIEIVAALAEEASRRLRRLGYDSVTVRHGDGYLGWPSEAPFDAVVVTAGAPEIPDALVAQLRPEGRMVIPVGPEYGVQYLVLLEKDADGTARADSLIPVRFVPMVRGRP